MLFLPSRVMDLIVDWKSFGGCHLKESWFIGRTFPDLLDKQKNMIIVALIVDGGSSGH